MDVTGVISKDKFIQPIDGEGDELRPVAAEVNVGAVVGSNSMLNAESDVHTRSVDVVVIEEPKPNPFAGIKTKYTTNWDFCGQLLQAQVHGLAKRMGAAGGMCILC